MSKKWYDDNPNYAIHIARIENSITIKYELTHDTITIHRLQDIKKLYEITQQVLFDTNL